MSTHARIAIPVEGAGYRAITVHYDGDTISELLENEYSHEHRILQLMEGGHVASLGKYLSLPEMLTFLLDTYGSQAGLWLFLGMAPEPKVPYPDMTFGRNVTTYMHRDENDDLEEEHFRNIKDLLAGKLSDGATAPGVFCTYVFINGCWGVSCPYVTGTELLVQPHVFRTHLQEYYNSEK